MRVCANGAAICIGSRILKFTVFGRSSVVDFEKSDKCIVSNRTWKMVDQCHFT